MVLKVSHSVIILLWLNKVVGLYEDNNGRSNTGQCLALRFDGDQLRKLNRCDITLFFVNRWT